MDGAPKSGKSPAGDAPVLQGMRSIRVGAHVAMYRGGPMGADSSHTLYACTRKGCSFRTHSYSTNLRNHLAEHFGDRPFICGECEYRSERFDSLRKHCRVHTGERPYACPVCGYRSKTNSNLHAHIRTKHNMPSGKAERMPSICAQYDTAPGGAAAAAAVAVAAAQSITRGAFTTGAVNSPINGKSSAAAGLAITNSGNGATNTSSLGTSGGETSGSSPESLARYHEVPMSPNNMLIPLPIPLTLMANFHIQGTPQATSARHATQQVHQQKSNSSSPALTTPPEENQPLDCSTGLAGAHKAPQ